MLDPVVGAGAGLAGYFSVHGGTISHRLVSVSADDVTPFGAKVDLSVGVSVGPGAGAVFGFGNGSGFRFGFGFGTGIDLNCRPGSSSCRYQASLVHLSASGLGVLRPPGSHLRCPLTFTLAGPVL